MTDNTLQTDLAACVEALGAAFGELSLSGSGYLMDDGRIVGEGVYSGDARAILAAVNFLRTHAPAIAELQARCEAAERDARTAHDRGFQEGYERRHAEVMGALV